MNHGKRRMETSKRHRVQDITDMFSTTFTKTDILFRRRDFSRLAIKRAPFHERKPTRTLIPLITCVRFKLRAKDISVCLIYLLFQSDCLKPSTSLSCWLTGAVRQEKKKTITADLYWQDVCECMATKALPYIIDVKIGNRQVMIGKTDIWYRLFTGSAVWNCTVSHNWRI